MSNRTTFRNTDRQVASDRVALFSQLSTRIIGRLAVLMACAALGAGPARAQAPSPNYQYMPFPTAHPSAPQMPSQFVEPELLPNDRGWLYDFDSRADLIIRETIRGSYMRLEYLNWDVQQPGANLLGAPLAGVEHPTEPFLVQTPTGQIAVAEVLSTRGADFGDLNGIRGTLGIPMESATFEGNVWGLAQGFHRIEDRPFLRDNNPLTPRFIAVSLLTDGQVGDRVLLFDRSFTADYTNDVWGSDVNLYYHTANPRDGVAFQPLLGFRYMAYNEKLNMIGQFDNSSGTFTGFGTLLDPVVSQINSQTDNRVYSLQTGFRAEYRTPWVTVGAEPKIAFGANDYDAKVFTSNLRDFDDPSVVDGPFDIDDPENVRSSVGRLLFTPTLDLACYASIRVTDWANLRVGYNLIYAGNIVRADRSIDYNDNGPANPPAVVARQKTSELWIQGLTVGGEIILP